jgi:hypothetical protein
MAWTTLCAGNPVTAVFPAKNGCLPFDSSGNSGVLAVGGVRDSRAWISFTARTFDTAHLKTAILLLPVKSIGSAGLCGVHALMTPVAAAEASVRARDLHYDDLPIAATAIDSSFADGMILLNVTEQVRSRAFFGVLIRSMGKLSATFGARKGVPSPAVICVCEPAGRPSAHWFTGKGRPDSSLGRPGDFYAQPVRGVVYRKTTVSWDSVLTLTPPPPPPAAAGRSRSGVRSKPKPVKQIKPNMQQ